MCRISYNVYCLLFAGLIFFAGAHPDFMLARIFHQFPTAASKILALSASETDHDFDNLQVACTRESASYPQNHPAFQALATKTGEISGLAPLSLPEPNYKKWIQEVRASPHFMRLKDVLGFTGKGLDLDQEYPETRTQAHDERTAEVANIIATRMKKNAARAEWIGLVHDFSALPLRHFTNLSRVGKWLQRNDYQPKRRIVELLKESGMPLTNTDEWDLLHFDINTEKNISEDAQIAVACESVAGVVEDLVFGIRFKLVQLKEIPQPILDLLDWNNLFYTLQSADSLTLHREIVDASVRILSGHTQVASLVKKAREIKALCREQLLEKKVFHLSKGAEPVLTAQGILESCVQYFREQYRETDYSGTLTEFEFILRNLETIGDSEALYLSQVVKALRKKPKDFPDPKDREWLRVVQHDGEGYLGGTEAPVYVLRGAAHQFGIIHHTSNVLLFSENPAGGDFQSFLQQRSKTKKDFPGMHTVSSGGHMGKLINAKAAAIGKNSEELGETIPPELLIPLGDPQRGIPNFLKIWEYRDKSTTLHFYQYAPSSRMLFMEGSVDPKNEPQRLKLAKIRAYLSEQPSFSLGQGAPKGLSLKMFNREYCFFFIHFITEKVLRDIQNRLLRHATDGEVQNFRLEPLGFLLDELKKLQSQNTPITDSWFILLREFPDLKVLVEKAWRDHLGIVTRVSGVEIRVLDTAA